MSARRPCGLRLLLPVPAPTRRLAKPRVREVANSSKYLAWDQEPSATPSPALRSALGYETGRSLNLSGGDPIEHLYWRFPFSVFPHTHEGVHDLRHSQAVGSCHWRCLRGRPLPLGGHRAPTDLPFSATALLLSHLGALLGGLAKN